MTETPDAPERPSEGGAPTVAIGLVLVVVGAILFAGQVAGIGIEDIGWPFFVIAAGIAILLIGLVVANEQGMVIGGTVVTTVGLVLFYQDQTGRWESWAYAWALVGPAASGLGLVPWGPAQRERQRCPQSDLGPARRARDLRRRVPLLRGPDRTRRRPLGASRVAPAGGGDRDRGGRTVAGECSSAANRRDL